MTDNLHYPRCGLSHIKLRGCLKSFSMPRSGRKKVAREVKRLVKFPILSRPEWAQRLSAVLSAREILPNLFEDVSRPRYFLITPLA
jgi:hypothetical protein